MCRASVQGEPLFDDGDQDLDRDGDPDLRLHRILGRPEEAFDRQVPINPKSGSWVIARWRGIGGNYSDGERNDGSGGSPGG
jgi:hypothetical protein